MMYPPGIILLACAAAVGVVNLGFLYFHPAASGDYKISHTDVVKLTDKKVHECWTVGLPKEFKPVCEGYVRITLVNGINRNIESQGFINRSEFDWLYQDAIKNALFALSEHKNEIVKY